ncbi:MAG: Bug family tripartite tricarboxylate transporter substrate binding protein [Burkholderiales bacterium]
MKLANAALAVGVSLTLSALPHGAAHAQAYPSKTVRIINAFAPGGPSGLLSRTIADKLSAAWGQPVIVDAKTGAAGNIGVEYAAKQPADGYTLLTMPAGNAVVNPLIFSKLGYETLRDFTPVTLLGRVENLLVVNPDTPVYNVRDLIAWAKQHPGKLSFSSPGVGSFGHVAGEQLKAASAIDVLHIPYKGTAPAMNDVMGGAITMSFVQVSTALPNVKSGKLRALGLASPQRSPLLPELPTVAEQGLPGFQAVSWYALMAPAGTPKEIVAKVSGEVNRILKLPDVRKRLEGLGATPAGGTPEETADMIRAEAARIAPVVKAANIRAN